MELKLHPLRQNALNIVSAYETTQIWIANNPKGDGITVGLMAHIKGEGGPPFNKIRIVENSIGLIYMHIFACGVSIPDLEENEKIVWSNF